MNGIGFGQSGIAPKRVSTATADSTILYGDISFIAGAGIDISVTGKAITITGNYIETDPVVGAINGIVKANGAGVISAAVANTDYVTPSLAIALAAAL